MPLYTDLDAMWYPARLKKDTGIPTATAHTPANTLFPKLVVWVRFEPQ